MGGMVGSAQRVESQSLQHPEHEEEESHHEQYDWQQHDHAVAGDKVSGDLDDACGQGYAFSEAADQKQDEKGKEEAENRYDDASCLAGGCS